MTFILLIYRNWHNTSDKTEFIKLFTIRGTIAVFKLLTFILSFKKESMTNGKSKMVNKVSPFPEKYVKEEKANLFHLIW